MQDKIVQQYTKQDTDDVDLRLLFQTLIEKKWIILTIGIIVFISAMTYALLKPAKYQASILLKIQHKQQSAFGGIANLNPQLINMLEEPIAVQVALIQSEFILAPVIRSLSLTAPQMISKNTQESDIINQLRANLTVTDLSGSENNNKVAILRISLRGTDPEMVTKTLNEIATITQQQNIKLKALEAEKTLKFLKQQLPTIQKNLEEAETKSNQLRSMSGRIDTKFQTQNLLSHIADINKQIESIHLKKMNMLHSYTFHHPYIIALSQEVSELEKNRSLLLQQLKQLPSSDQEALDLVREVNIKSNMYISILNQIRQLEIFKSGIMSDIQILTAVTKPYVFHPLKLSLISFFSLFVGLVLGSMGVLTWRLITSFSIPTAK
ncbi:MAG TPA: Wzz/FepE/Etk N-terminal domain-containing protein [Gammaproteobacteria bacterium]|nr:Wzz/FepE/Etk N-terminal domain-containing protein [Gammaproteobacteria bacterium]